MEYLNDIIQQIATLGSAALTVAGCVAIGYVIRMLPISNRFIPAVCPVVGEILYSTLAKPGDVNPEIHNPIVAQALIGFILGFIAWIGHKALITKLEEKYPSLKEFFDGQDADKAASPLASPPPGGWPQVAPPSDASKLPVVAWFVAYWIGVMCIIVALLAQGCAGTTKTIVYKSLSAVGNSVDTAMKISADMKVKGQITPMQWNQIAQAHARYQPAFHAAVIAAKLDYSQPAATDLQALAQAVIDAITPFVAKGTP